MFVLKEIPADEMHFDFILSGLVQGGRNDDRYERGKHSENLPF